MNAHWIQTPRTLALAAAFALLGPLGMGCQEPVIDARVDLRLLRGEADPLEDPGTPSRASSPVGSLAVSWIGGPEPVTKIVPLDGSAELGLRFDRVPAGPSRVVVRGLRATDEVVYSAAVSAPFEPHPTEVTSVKLFFGPVNAFTPVGSELGGSRTGASVAALGNAGALVSGGLHDGALAEPAVLVYRMDEGRVCGEAEGCLHGELPPARREGIAIAVKGGAVLHGLGALAGDALDATLYLTQSDGRTERLVLGGDALPPLRGATAIALADGSALVFGGQDGAAPSSAVFRIDVAARSVTRQPALLTARVDAGAALLATGEVLVAGGIGQSGPLMSAEVYVPGEGSEPVDGGAFELARNSLRGPRVRPAMVRLADDSVLLMGGGTEQGEVFRLDLGLEVGGFVDLGAPPEGLRMKSPAAVRLGSQVLVAGGEDPTLGGPRAALFAPDPDQVIGSASPSYVGTWTAVGASAVPREQTALAELADGSALMVGGGDRVEVFVPMPSFDGL
jgi:hypothetical protein